MDIDITQGLEVGGALIAIVAAGLGIQKGSAKWNAAKELTSDVADFVARAYQVPELRNKAQGRNDQENPTGIETIDSLERVLQNVRVATTKKTRQGLKRRSRSCGRLRFKLSQRPRKPDRD